MNVWINGEERHVRVETLGELVIALAGTEAGCAAALNDAIVPKCEWARTSLRPGDRVEIVGAVAGG
jgi:sulfur carrier protein